MDGGDGFTSLTNGFSVRKPKRAKKKDALVPAVTTSLNKRTLQHFYDPLETAPLRQRLYEEQWRVFNSKIMDFEESWHNTLTEDVRVFIETSLPTCFSSDWDKTISAAVLITGLSPDENCLLFDSLVKKVQEDLPLIARVSSISCPNVKAAFQNVCKQLMRSNCDASRFVEDSEIDLDEDDTGDEIQDQYTAGNNSKRQASIDDLNTWYKSKKSDGTGAQTVLIILEDIDVFPENVVQELLLLLSCCNFPIILILGVLHGFVQLERLLPSETESAFQYKKFYAAVSPQERLEKFFDLAMLDWEFPFRLGGDLIKFLSEYFLHYQFSMKRLLQAYQLCLIQHFRSEFTVFNGCDINSISDQVDREFSTETFEYTLNTIPSWKRMHNKGAKSPLKSPTKRMKPMVEKDPLELIVSELKACYSKLLDWHAMLLTVYEMGSGLPENPIGSSLSELYFLAWKGDLLRKRSDEVQSPMEKLLLLVSNFSKQEMDRRVSSAQKRINAFIEQNKESKVIDMTAPDILKTLETLLTRLRVEPKPKLKVEPDSPRPKRSTANQSLFELREAMLKRIHANKDDPEYDDTREAIKKFLLTNSKSKLKATPESSIPFAEVFIFNDIEFLKNKIAPNVQLRIHSALCNSAGFLSCECCQDSTEGSITPTLPDLSIVYKLFQEQTTRALNMNDMFMSFKSIIDESAAPRRRGSMSKKAIQKQEQYLIRFKHAVSELQFMGFMKPSRSKPDEVFKQSWVFSANLGS